MKNRKKKTIIIFSLVAFLLAGVIRMIVLMPFAGGNTLLHVTAAFSNHPWNHPWVAKALLGAGARLEARNHYGETPLHLAVASGMRGDHNLRFLLVLLDAHSDLGVNVDARNEDGLTPLHYAAWTFKNAGIVRALVNAGDADVNAKGWNNSTPLHQLMQKMKIFSSYEDYHRDCHIPAIMVTDMKVLLEVGADPTLTNSAGDTPWQVFATENLFAETETGQGILRILNEEKSTFIESSCQQWGWDYGYKDSMLVRLGHKAGRT